MLLRTCGRSGSVDRKCSKREQRERFVVLLDGAEAYPRAEIAASFSRLSVVTFELVESRVLTAVVTERISDVWMTSDGRGTGVRYVY